MSTVKFIHQVDVRSEILDGVVKRGKYFSRLNSLLQDGNVKSSKFGYRHQDIDKIIVQLQELSTFLKSAETAEKLSDNENW